jgi:hypothetical protein
MLFKKLKTEIQYDPAVPLLGIYLKASLKSAYNGDTWAPMCLATLFIVPKIWNRPRCPLTTEQIKKM